MRILYELHSLKQRRAYMVIRAEIEEKHRQRVEMEVSDTDHELWEHSRRPMTLTRHTDHWLTHRLAALYNVITVCLGEKVERKDLRPESSSDQHHQGDPHLPVGRPSRQVQIRVLTCDDIWCISN